nr:ribonuclease H-like domain-containing protein [Tanacetum cinerariifolium]
MKNNLKQTVFDSGVTKDLNHENFFDNENPKRPNDEERVSSNDDGTDLSPEFQEFNSEVEEFSVNTVKRSSRYTKLPTSFNDLIIYGKVKYGVEKVVNYANLSHENFFPSRFDDKDNKNKVCKLVKSLYGLKQALRKWNEKLVVLKENGFVRSANDHYLFTRSKDNKFIALLVYVDDVVVIGNCVNEIDKFKSFLKSKFNIKDLGDANPVRTFRDYSKPSHEGYRNTIELPVGNNVVPLLFNTIWLVQNGCSFYGLRFEDSNQHQKDFLKLVDSLDLDIENKEKTHLRFVKGDREKLDVRMQHLKESTQPGVSTVNPSGVLSYAGRASKMSNDPSNASTRVFGSTDHLKVRVFQNPNSDVHSNTSSFGVFSDNTTSLEESTQPGVSTVNPSGVLSYAGRASKMSNDPSNASTRVFESADVNPNMHTLSLVEKDVVPLHNINNVANLFGVPLNSLSDIDEFVKDLPSVNLVEYGVTCDGSPKVSNSSPLVSPSTTINVPREPDSIDVAATFGVPLTTVGDLHKLTNDIEASKLIYIRFRRECEDMIDELKSKFNGMSIKINKKKELQYLEQVANLSTYPSQRFRSICYDDDDDYDYEKSTIPLNEIISQLPPSIVIATSPPILPIEDPEDSLIMRNKDLSTISEKESDEFIKSSVDDLVPILSESEDTSGSDSECILPSCDDFSHINFLRKNP